MPGIIEKAGMKAVHVATVGIALQHHRLHVVIEHLVRHAGKEAKRVVMSCKQRLQLLVVTELNIGRPAPAKRADEHLELVGTTPDRRPICLHLATRFGFKPHHRIGLGNGPQATHECLEARVATVVAAGLDLAQKDRCRDHIRCRRLHPTSDVILVGVQLLSPLRARLARCRSLAFTQIPPHRVARDTKGPGDPVDALTMLV